MIVRVKHGQETYFRSKARDSQNEILAYLVGTVGESQATIKYFAYPEYADQTPNEVAATTESFNAIRDTAEVSGLTVCGTMHSHPNWWPVKSPADHNSQLAEAQRIAAVCAVMVRRTKVYYWVAESSLPCKVQYY